ncbi:AMP-binding protein [Massilia sp. GCM10023247]|uniref:AMP-binding protein n=1 Tax=Massilia sp. GCM10023247 TaxID=3252643 RepID=UPI00360858AC
MDAEQLKAALLHQYHRWRWCVPKAMLYHPDHFLVRRLLAASRHVQEASVERRLRRILQSAVTHVPYYRGKVKLGAGELEHAPVSELIGQFPYIDKIEVMERQHAFLDERIDRRFLLYAASHGSTGTGIGVWRNKRETDIEKAFYVGEWGRFGFDFDKSRYLRIGYDATRPLEAAPTWRFGNRLMLSPEHVRPDCLSIILRAIERFRPQFIHAYPSAALALAELLAQRGHGLGLPLRGVLLGSEPASAAQLALIARVFDAPVSISYGLTERTNLAFAVHDEAGASPYQFQALYGWTENRLSHGCHEIVGTSLWNEVMPLIRYCTGDYALIGPDGRCDDIDGRLQEFVLDRHGNRLPGLTIALDACAWHFIKACQLYQRERGKVTLRVVPRNGTLGPDQRAALLAGPICYWGRDVEFDCVEVPDIAVGPGRKRCFVVNDIPLAPT